MHEALLRVDLFSSARQLVRIAQKKRAYPFVGYAPGKHDFDQASSITPIGQVPAHAPQLMQESASISYLSSPSAIAPTGHAPAHAPHMMHPSVITYAMIVTSLKNE